MTSRLRFTMCCLLALALSFQGASAAAAHCAAGGGAADIHPGMSMSGPMATSMAVESRIHDTDVDGTASTAHSHRATTHPGAAKCGACTPCCIAAAPPMARLEIARVDVPHTVSGTVASPSSSFLTEGQDRPPRSILA